MSNLDQYKKAINSALCFLIPLLVLSCSSKTDLQLVQNATEAQKNGDDRSAMIYLKNALQKNPNNVKARKILGFLFVKYRDGPAAEKELIKAQEIGGPDTSILVPLSRSYLYQEKYQPAIDLLGGYSPENPDDAAWSEAVRGDAYMGLKKYEAAEQQYDKALRIRSDFLPAIIGKAKLYIYRKEFEQAKKLLSVAILSEEGVVDARVLLGEINIFVKNNSAAADNFEKALEIETKKQLPVEEFYIRTRLASSLVAEGKLEQGLQQVDILLKKSPDNPIPHYLRATIAYRQGDLSKASEHLLVVLKIAPDHKPSTLLLGAVNFGKGNFEQADLNLKSILDEDPTNTMARKWLGATRLKLNKPKDAIELIKPALKINPSDPQLLDIMSNAVLALGDAQEAIDYLSKGISENPESSALRSSLATAYLAIGDTDQAIKELEAVTGIEQQNYKSQALLVLSYAKNRDFSKAEKLAQILIQKYPNEPNPKYLLANVYMFAAEESKAKLIYGEIVEKSPDFIPAMSGLAKIEYRKGNYDISQEYLDRIIKIKPNNASVIVAYVQLLEKKGESQKAVDWLEAARSRDQRALTPRILLSKYYLRKGDLSKIDQIIAEMKKIGATDSAVLMIQGILDIKNNNYDSAKVSFDKLLKSQPNNAEAHFHLGEVYWGLKEIESARSAFSKAIELQPENIALYWSLTQMEIGSKQFATAKKLILTIKKRYPDAVIGNVLLGDLYVAQKDLKSAYGVYAKALKASPNGNLLLKQYAVLQKLHKNTLATKLLKDWLESHPKSQLVRVALAEDYQSRGAKKLAIEEYKKVLELKANAPGILNNLAWLLYEEGDPKALEYAQEANKLAPNHGAITDTLGWLYIQNGRNEQGLIALEQAVRLAPDVPDIRYHLAVALEKNGKKESSKKLLQELLANYKSFSTKEDATSLLKRLR